MYASCFLCVAGVYILCSDLTAENIRTLQYLLSKRAFFLAVVCSVLWCSDVTFQGNSFMRK